MANKPAMVWRMHLGRDCLLAVVLLGCVPEPPARWAQGGAPVVIPEARFDRGKGDPILIHADGRVEEDGDLLFAIDRAGRVFDEDNEPVALLNADGSVSGRDDVYLGRVGMQNASPPWSGTAWLRVRSDGKVALYDSDGEPQYGGKWTGCEVPKTRACTLITHLLALDSARRRQESGVQVGIGVGVMY
jgi:hypothetical protein